MGRFQMLLPEVGYWKVERGLVTGELEELSIEEDLPCKSASSQMKGTWSLQVYLLVEDSLQFGVHGQCVPLVLRTFHGCFRSAVASGSRGSDPDMFDRVMSSNCHAQGFLLRASP